MGLKDEARAFRVVMVLVEWLCDNVRLLVYVERRKEVRMWALRA